MRKRSVVAALVVGFLAGGLLFASDPDGMADPDNWGFGQRTVTGLWASYYKTITNFGGSTARSSGPLTQTDDRRLRVEAAIPTSQTITISGQATIAGTDSGSTSRIARFTSDRVLYARSVDELDAPVAIGDVVTVGTTPVRVGPAAVSGTRLWTSGLFYCNNDSVAHTVFIYSAGGAGTYSATAPGVHKVSVPVAGTLVMDGNRFATLSGETWWAKLGEAHTSAAGDFSGSLKKTTEN